MGAKVDAIVIVVPVKSGLKCTTFCKECLGTSCRNIEIDNDNEVNVPIYDVDLEDRNFMDIFV